MQNILSVDLEDWYHPAYMKLRKTANPEDRILMTLDETLRLLASHNVCATFFVVGELVEKHPEIVEKIGEGGHELAFHGFYHRPLSELTPEILRSEIRRFSAFTKGKCLGFRAPSFSLNKETKWALEILEEEGYTYDSSIFPSKTPLYGHWRAPTRPYKVSAENITKENGTAKLWELPLLIYSIIGIRVPVAGGFYLRFLPTSMISRAIKKTNRSGCPAVVFFHNWELDTQMPRIRLGLWKSFVTYHKLDSTRKKLEVLLSRFDFSSAENFMKRQDS